MLYPLLALAAALSAPEMLVWAEASTPEAGLSLHQGWVEVEHIFKEAGFVPREDFPKIFRSDTVAGLKPGLYIWALGVCPAAEAKERLALLKKINSAAYSRPVSGEEIACPSLAPDAELRPVRILASFADHVLLAVETEEQHRAPPDERRQESYRRTWLHLILADKSRARVFEEVCIERGEEHQYSALEGRDNFECAAAPMQRRGETFIWKRICLPKPARCGTYAKETTVTKVTIQGNHIEDVTETEHAGYVECE